MRLLFVVNPISGGVNKEPFLKEAKSICKNYGLEFKIFTTTGVNDNEELSKVLKRYHPNKVVSVGGDGTTLFTAINLLNTEIPMGIIPLGSANGMAVELGVPQKPIEAFKDIIMSNIIGDLDLICVNKKHYCIHIGDVGINATIVDGYEKDANRGMATYAKYFVDALSKTEPFKIEIECNNEVQHYEGVMLGICNARKYGTGVPLSLEGNPMDGLFEIVIIEKINANVLIKAGLSSFDENFLDSQNQTLITTSKAIVHFTEPRLLQLDGEIIGDFKTLEIKMLKGAVKLITTKCNVYL
ncbi:diacylglycerol kinase family protein [Tamlana sp. 2_MG-2023]|uniref:diacylglycerol/lipid kinase family protein n=1 Tax=unclassified Tamlana TaxID=2614803 RepID=UPI0026E12474|nr:MULTISPECIES: diacylglycerol kinase family protein [unclassified Tamlana]MDO6759550.1 diacylglycerol kinase family protein [Tamlana sp. 2_MG-2023]MDO6790311.1 diacylglycerol kinase family protein [Tamlana sp. 1_MG-2023]